MKSHPKNIRKTVIPKIQEIIKNWTRYVDDRFPIVEAKNLSRVKNELNRFHESIKFTHELEKDNKISFLNVLIKRIENDTPSASGIETSVYRKPTNTDIPAGTVRTVTLNQRFINVAICYST